MSDLTPEDVQEILRLIDQAGYDEFELETPRFSVRFNRNADVAPNPASVDSTQSPRAAGAEGVVDVVAPMVGIVYSGPAPGERPFVEVGSRVERGTQLCIIEVMKLMNAVTAVAAGTIAEVCFESGAAVQYGDVLFRIRVDG